MSSLFYFKNNFFVFYFLEKLMWVNYLPFFRQRRFQLNNVFRKFARHSCSFYSLCKGMTSLWSLSLKFHKLKRFPHKKEQALHVLLRAEWIEIGPRLKRFSFERHHRNEWARKVCTTTLSSLLRAPLCEEAKIFEKNSSGYITRIRE